MVDLEEMDPIVDQTESLQLDETIDTTRPELDGRRKLLLVYIHGFMGDESSFRGFPAHLHNLLTIFLSETHAVYSKIYPRYRSKKNIRIARDDFSTWLKPHETSTTDVILLGHSMGGLITADVAIMQAANERHTVFEHRILGTINFDVPFLGMHPGVVRSGLASIFVPSEQTHEDKYSTTNLAGSSEALSDTHSNDEDIWKKQDPKFNASFRNDVTLPNRSFWAGLQHFLVKHNMNAVTAAQTMISAHVEFMSAMNNTTELKSRYAKIRILEEESDAARRSVISNQLTPPRIRFINYYTISTGRPKNETATKAERDALPAEVKDGLSERSAIIDDGSSDMQSLKSSSTTVQADVPDETTEMPPFGEVIVAKEGSVKSRSHSSDPVPAKERKFCKLPPKDSKGERDPTWVPIFMKDVDEVGAHCGMFFVDERYERLVGEVAERIEAWVSEDMSFRLAQESMLPIESVD